MAIMTSRSPVKADFEGMDDLEPAAKQAALTAMAKDEVRRRQLVGLIFNDVRFDLCEETDNELLRACLMSEQDVDNVYVRPHRGADLVELTAPELSELAIAYFNIRRLYQKAEYELVKAIAAGRVRDSEAIRAWAGWPGASEATRAG